MEFLKRFLEETNEQRKNCREIDHKDGKEPPGIVELWDLCDGVANCPEGEDEDFEACKRKGAFPTTATHECQSKWVNDDVTVRILATRCNGVEECKDGSDEIDCGDSKLVLGLVIASCFVAFLSITSLIIIRAKVQKIDHCVDFERSNNEELEALVVNARKSDQRKQACLFLFERSMAKHDGNVSKTLNELQVCTYKYQYLLEIKTISCICLIFFLISGSTESFCNGLFYGQCIAKISYWQDIELGHG